jgi:hypothetical protein
LAHVAELLDKLQQPNFRADDLLFSGHGGVLQSAEAGRSATPTAPRPASAIVVPGGQDTTVRLSLDGYGEARTGENVRRFSQIAADQPRHEGHAQVGHLRHRRDQEPRELGEVGDAGENVYQHATPRGGQPP